MAAVAILLVLALVISSYQMAPIVRAIPRSNNDFAFEFPETGYARGADIAFYFDFSSPYGYFAAQYIEGLAARYGRSVRWFPILMPAIFKVTGGGPLPPMPIKGPYILRDFERTAHLHGIPYRQPKTLPMVSLAPARAMLWVQQTHGEAAAVAFAKRCYSAYFWDGVDICDYQALAGIAESLGIDGAGLAAGAQSETIKRRFIEANEQALERGVFGSPFVIVDGEHFWGFDHLYQVEARLSGRTHLNSFPNGRLAGSGAGLEELRHSAYKFCSL